MVSLEAQSKQLTGPLAELELRKQESLRLYEPLASQKDYHECRASAVIGLGGNRAGKTLAFMAEIARRVTEQDPHQKLPDVPGQKIQVIIGKDWDHIGNIIFPYLFREGAFYTITDKVTGQLRAWRPWDAGDLERKAERKAAPPLIPKRFIKPKTWAWISKSKRQFKKVELTTGWEIRAYSSEGDPPQGFKALAVNIDEDINREDWVPEMMARLSDLKGVFHWSAMPHSKCDSLVTLSDQADEQLSRDNPDIVKIKFRFLDNPFIDADEKRKRMESWEALGEDVLRMRCDGEFLTESRLVYPTFHKDTHSIELKNLPGGGKRVPDHWTRYAFIDPGHNTCAVTFYAVPPPEEWDHVLLYDELYIRQCDAEVFGEKMKQKTEGQVFQAFVMDMRGGRITDIGSGQPAFIQYRRALEKRNIRSEWSGSGFLPGSEDIEGRVNAVRLWLRMQDDQLPKLVLLKTDNDGVTTFMTPNFINEMKKYRKKIVRQHGHEVVLDEPVTRGPCHAIQTVEYAAAFSPRYVARKQIVPKATSPWDWIEKMKRKRQATASGLVVNLGPQH